MAVEGVRPRQVTVAGRWRRSGVSVVVAAISIGAAQAPVRDSPQQPAAAARAGTGVLAGVVVNDETPGRPVRRATVTLTGAPLPTSRQESTDDDGRFTFRDLPAGRYTLTASRPAFVRMAYGARRHDRAGVAIALAAGQTVSGLSIVMPRGAVITGVVSDSRGRPVRGAAVTAMQPGVQNYERTLAPARTAQAAGAQISATTDERGEYRLFGLPAGLYAVQARARVQSPAATPFPTSLSLQSQFFHPGTIDPAAAGMISLKPADERQGVDITIGEVPTAAVRGTLLGAGEAAGAYVFLVPGGSGIASVTADSAGWFAFAGVPPGDYVVAARAPWPKDKPVQALWGRAAISLHGQDLDQVLIDMRPGTSVRGRLQIEGAPSTADALGRVGLMLRAVSPWRAEVLPARIGPDGRFVIDAVTPGRYLVVAAPLAAAPASAPALTLKSVVINGEDVVDLPFDLAPAAASPEMVVTMTALSQQISGRMLDGSGRPRTDLSLLVFPADPRFWLPGSRRVHLLRPATDGYFEAVGLPAGDYRMLAFGETEPDDPTDPRFLEPLLPAATPIALAPGERKVQDIRTKP